MASALSVERSVRSASGAGRLQQGFGRGEAANQAHTGRNSIDSRCANKTGFNPKPSRPLAQRQHLQPHLPCCCAQKSKTAHTPCASTSCSRPSSAANSWVTSWSHLDCGKGREKRHASDSSQACVPPTVAVACHAALTPSSCAGHQQRSCLALMRQVVACSAAEAPKSGKYPQISTQIWPTLPSGGKLLAAQAARMMPSTCARASLSCGGA